MKKLFLPLVALFASATVMAQDFKPVAGNVTLEANVNLLGGSVNLNNSLNQIKARYFLSDDMAVRVGFGLGMSTTKNVANTDSSWTEDKMSSWSFSPGIEKHFEGTDRLSPYAGLDIMIGGANFKGESLDINGFGKTETTYEGITSTGDRAYGMFGVNLVAGTDFYFAKHIYLGYEIGFGFSSQKDKDWTTTSTSTSGTTTTTVTTESGKDEGTKWSGISANVRNGIRFGFVF